MKKVFGLVSAVLATIGVYYLSYYNLIPQKTYTAEDFDIETVISQNDQNGNGIDDYTDIMLGARQMPKTNPGTKVLIMLEDTHLQMKGCALI